MRILSLVACCGLACLSAGSAEPATTNLVLVYGATPAGIAATLALGRSSRPVMLIEPTERIGGLVTHGLSHTDFRTFEGLTGAYLQFAARVQAHYAQAYGSNSSQALGCFRGTHAEPGVNLAVFEQMLAECPAVKVLKLHRLTNVSMESDSGVRRIRAATFRGLGGARTFEAAVFIDATYEGDLMATAGVNFTVGREGRDAFDESLAPVEADSQLQGYNFRLVMTRDPANRVHPAAPAGYSREEFLAVLPFMETGRIKTVFCASTGGIYKAQVPPLPNGKHDINDVSGGLVRLSLPGSNLRWPNGDAPIRARIADEHLRHNLGLLFFLQNDADVPERFRREAREWGLCKDEFAETGHVPTQLYVREARRMRGAYIFTERDMDYAAGDARAVLHTNAIAMGDYGPNCHGTLHDGPRIGGRHTGEFYKPVPPYQVPYGVLVPRQVANLLVPCACSASHVGFCALRLEPIWMSLGEAAGFAAHLALAHRTSVGSVPVGSLQHLLHQQGAATIYVSDVLPGSPEFAAVQWWATAGGLHQLAATPAKPGQRGQQLVGQYYESFPGHAAELELPLSSALRERWRQLAAAQGIAADSVGTARTRGDFIRAAYGAWCATHRPATPTGPHSP